MSDHYPYGYADEHHSHGEYADQRHDHDVSYAEKYHRHREEESLIAGLREDLGHAEARITELQNHLRDALRLIRALEGRLHDHEQLSPAGES